MCSFPSSPLLTCETLNPEDPSHQGFCAPRDAYLGGGGRGLVGFRVAGLRDGWGALGLRFRAYLVPSLSDGIFDLPTKTSPREKSQRKLQTSQKQRHSSDATFRKLLQTTVNTNTLSPVDFDPKLGGSGYLYPSPLEHD